MCRFLCAIIGPLCLIGSIIIYLVLPAAVKFMIKDRMAILPGTDYYPKWAEMPVPLEFKIYIFEVTNPSEVLRGQSPFVVQKGPYFF